MKRAWEWVLQEWRAYGVGQRRENRNIIWGEWRSEKGNEWERMKLSGVCGGVRVGAWLQLMWRRVLRLKP